MAVWSEVSRDDEGPQPMMAVQNLRGAADGRSDGRTDGWDGMGWDGSWLGRLTFFRDRMGRPATGPSEAETLTARLFAVSWSPNVLLLFIHSFILFIIFFFSSFYP